MAVYRRFEDLQVWQDSRVLNKALFDILKDRDDKSFGFLINHIFKTAGSVMDNIAEGFERNGKKEFIQFLSISKASAGELKSQLYRALDCEIISIKELESLIEKSNSIIAQLVLFMKYLQASKRRGSKYEDVSLEYEENLNWESFFNS
ncbi:four helix bundle protein [Crocinitomicaceae bacterium]|nr:four helix bundle protein [Crocinitomicaceae bacterium]